MSSNARRNASLLSPSGTPGSSRDLILMTVVRGGTRLRISLPSAGET